MLQGAVCRRGNPLQGSASFGYSIYPEDGTTIDSLLSAADAAMYKAKHSSQAQTGVEAKQPGPEMVLESTK